MNNLWLFIVLAVCVLGMGYVFINYFKIKHMEEGTEKMIKMSAIIREGANVFIKKEFVTIALVIAILTVLFSLFIEKLSGVTYLFGAVMSSCVCILGMKSATYANVRTANKARLSMNIGETVKVALKGGSISGLSVQACGLFGMTAIVLISFLSNVDFSSVNGLGIIPIEALKTNATVMRITTYSLGCSTVAMFNRVAGGNYTKAADISADILGKIRNDLPEDDARVPNVIADFIGDNVNDIAGNCSDLLESFVATISATIVIAITLFGNPFGNSVVSSFLEIIPSGLLDAGIFYPVVLAGGGLLGCVLGIIIVSIRKMGDNPSKELNLATYISAGITLVIALGVTYLCFGSQPSQIFEAIGWKAGWVTPWICCVLGLASGVAIGLITEYYTSTDYKPTQTIAEYATEGEAFVVTKGDAVGSRSCLLPVLIIGISLVISGVICGTYGIAVAALGMLSFVGTTVSIDAFGPIADNAGGLAESCGLPEDVRVITDKLDSVGNTTAAIGKGFAIGSAAFATVSLICAFIGNFASQGIEVPHFDDFYAIAGCIVGAALIEFFIAILTDNTIAAAKELADVGDRQLSDPAILKGEKDPDYNELVRLATTSALKRMLVPSVIALLVPLVGGCLLGPTFIVGILLGSTVVAITRAIFMGNSGGAFDNAKKYIESGAIPGHGKGSAAHKAAVSGDTIGDTRKDVVGVALDIFIKMMSTVATVLFVVIAVVWKAIWKK